MKLPSFQFDYSFLPLTVAFGIGLVVSSFGCIETEAEAIISTAPRYIGNQYDQIDQPEQSTADQVDNATSTSF